MHQTGKHYVHELDGLGYKMPKVFAIFTISALALMGVPGLAGFISKWNLAHAAVESGNVLSYFGIGCLLLSALLTAIYMLSIVVRAFFPVKEESTVLDAEKSAVGITARDLEEDFHDPNWKMMLPLFVFAIMIIIFGLFSSSFVSFFADVAYGIY